VSYPIVKACLGQPKVVAPPSATRLSLGPPCEEDGGAPDQLSLEATHPLVPFIALGVIQAPPPPQRQCNPELRNGCHVLAHSAGLWPSPGPPPPSSLVLSDVAGPPT